MHKVPLKRHPESNKSTHEKHFVIYNTQGCLRKRGCLPNFVKF